MCLIFLIKSQT